MSDQRQIMETKQKRASYLRTQATEAETSHNQLTQIRNRLMAGTATRDDIFLALNKAATQMLIFSRSLTIAADLASTSCHIDRKEKSTAVHQYAPSPRQRTGGKDSTMPTTKTSPRKTVTGDMQHSNLPARKRPDAIDRMTANLQEIQQHLEGMLQIFGEKQTTRQPKRKPGPALRLIIGGKHHPKV